MGDSNTTCAAVTPFESLAYPTDDLHRHQRMAAKLKEIVLDADSLETENLRPDSRPGLLVAVRGGVYSQRIPDYSALMKMHRDRPFPLVFSGNRSRYS